jgi:DNA-binding CsgD family transcriptional regulator
MPASSGLPGPAATGLRSRSRILVRVVRAGDTLELGREACAARRWADAYELLSEADRATPLAASDLELLAMCASMTGRMDDSFGFLERQHRSHLDADEGLPAARAAITLGMNLAIRGELGPARGWFARAQRLVEREGRECAEHGYLLLPVALEREMTGDFNGSFDAAAEAAEIAARFRDTDLSALAFHVQGLMRIKQGRLDEGLRLLDEAMVAVASGEVSPVLTGVVYCGVIGGCEQAFDPRRASEWTNALTRWWEEQPQMVSFTGRCLAHRAGIMQLHGRWGEALDEARRARERCEQAMNRPAAGQALYQQGELHRLRGELAAADSAYRDANTFGREPQPGLALLRLAQGDTAAAAAAIRRALGEAAEPLQRASLLPAYAEIMLALGDAGEARNASDELSEIVPPGESAMLAAIAGQVRGAVELADGDAQTALGALRSAMQVWQELEAPYDVARARVLVGAACRALGDEASAELELEAARATFERLGAAPDVARVIELTRPGAAHDTHGLTARELEVLRLIAAGKTNREIAADLVVSEHTVARHVQNILVKLRVPSRTAATAFAFEHELV